VKIDITGFVTFFGLLFMIQMQGSPVTPVNSHSSSVSDPPAPWILSEEIDSGTTTAYAGGEK